MLLSVALLLVSSVLSVSSFVEPLKQQNPAWARLARAGRTVRAMASSSSSSEAAVANNNNLQHLVDPAERDRHYGSPMNVAQYLVDLHDAKATFDFCGGLMFQFVLSDQLRDHLVNVASAAAAAATSFEKKQQHQPVMIFDATKPRMFQIPGYSQTAAADNCSIFHGREIRNVPNAAGGMGLVLQLSSYSVLDNDPAGWTAPELQGYDGWGHDSGRVWRTGETLEQLGYKDFRKEYGPKSYTLNHRFYLHLDASDRMWLAAEDGCEGTPAAAVPIASQNPLSKLFGMLS